MEKVYKYCEITTTEDFYRVHINNVSQSNCD